MYISLENPPPIKVRAQAVIQQSLWSTKGWKPFSPYLVPESAGIREIRKSSKIR